MPLPLVPDEGKVGFMGAVMMAVASGANNAKVRLFVNNYTPDNTTSWTSFTEASAGGLVAQPTPAATDQGVIVGGPDNWVFGTSTFTASGVGLPVTVYGYWVDFTDPFTGLRSVLWAQRFNTPQSLINPGDFVTFVLNLAGNQC